VKDIVLSSAGWPWTIGYFIRKVLKMVGKPCAPFSISIALRMPYTFGVSHNLFEIILLSVLWHYTIAASVIFFCFETFYGVFGATVSTALPWPLLSYG
jgi:hypothetical protein